MEFFAGLEADRFSRGDRDLGASPGITANAGLPRFHGKDTEAAKFNAVTGNQVLLHAVEDGVDGSLCFDPRKAGTFNNPLYKILFNHFGPPSFGCNLFSTHLLTGFSTVMVESRHDIVNVRTLP
jgi:hypothetical protein